MSLESQIRGGWSFPNRNLDFTIEATADYSAYVNKFVKVGSDYSLSLPSAPLLVGIYGILQDMQPAGQIQIIRYSGISKAVYAETISAGDLITFADGTGKVQRFLSDTGGHVHETVIEQVRRVVYVTNNFGAPITGGAANFTTTLEYDNSGTLTASGSAVTVTEISGGRYWVTFTPDDIGSLWLLSLTYSSGGIPGIVTPSDFQMVSTAQHGGPAIYSNVLVVGQALESGVLNDTKLILVRPQVY